VALYAQDKGIDLALQTHPEITGNNEETLTMIEEVGVESLKVGLDLPLFEAFDHDFVRNTVYSMKGLMVYSHTISLAKSATVGGAPYSWEEVTPGSAKDTLSWEIFLKACKDIGYNGYLSHEQCSPIIVKDHKLGTLETIDQRYIDPHKVGPGMDSEASDWIIKVLDKDDPRPVWFTIWGGPRELAQAI